MPNYFSKQGYEKYKKHLSELEESLSKLQAQVKEACETGGNDWHDNFGYESLTRRISMEDKRLNESYRLLNDAEVITYPSSVDKVVLGCEVRISIDGNGEKSYQIVGHGESDSAKNKILYTSPVASALMRHCPGETVSAFIGGKKKDIRIVEVSPLKNEAPREVPVYSQ